MRFASMNKAIATVARETVYSTKTSAKLSPLFTLKKSFRIIKVFSALRFLSRQCCTIRGNGDENDSYSMQLLKLCGESDNIIAHLRLNRD